MTTAWRASPFKRDVCKELADAAHKDGNEHRLVLFSHGLAGSGLPDRAEQRYVQRMHGHLRELLGNYGTIDLLWFDTDGGPAPWDQPETYRLVRSPPAPSDHQQSAGYGQLEDYKAQRIRPDADYPTPGTIVLAHSTTSAAVGNLHDPRHAVVLEAATTRSRPSSNASASWSRCVTGDGNLLLNVGPMPKGEIEPRQVEVLRQIGAWLRRYGESVYGTRGGPFRNGDWGGATRKGNSVYLHILKWNGDHLTLPPLKDRIISARALTGGTVRYEQTGGETTVRMPIREQDTVNTVVKLETEARVPDR